MRIFVASLIVLAAVYFWDKDYNNGKLLDGRTAWGGPSRIVCFVRRHAVPDLTRNAGIQLNKRVSLQRHAKTIA
jgi:hypothetical protein